MSLGRTQSEYEANESLSRNSRGGLDLIDDGSGKLREKKRSDFHTPGCQCHFCRQVCCVVCHQLQPSNIKTWVSLTGFGRHVQTRHSAYHTFVPEQAKVKRLVKQLRQVQVAKELKRIANTSLRKINIKAITEKELTGMALWVQRAHRSTKAKNSADPLILQGIEHADDKYTGAKKFEKAVRALTAELARGVKSGQPVTSQRTTYYDPRVAIEVLKLCYATGRGWSFIIHLLLLYGLEAFINNLNQDGFSPPGSVPQVPKPSELFQNAATVIDRSLE